LEQCIPLSRARARNSKSNETITENKIKTCIMGQTNFKIKKEKKVNKKIKIKSIYRSAEEFISVLFFFPLCLITDW